MENELSGRKNHKNEIRKDEITCFSMLNVSCIIDETPKKHLLLIKCLELK